MRSDVEETNAKVRIPPHRKSPADTLVFSSAARNGACREPDDGSESVLVLEWRLPLIGSGRTDGNGSSIKRIQVALVPGSITEGIRSTGSIVGDGALVRHRDLADGLSGPVLFLADKIVDVIGVAGTGAEVKDQREVLMRRSLGSRRRRDPEQHKTHRKKQFRFHQNRPPWNVSVFRDPKLLAANASQAKGGTIWQSTGALLTH